MRMLLCPKFIYDGFKSRDQICINTSWNVCILIACFKPILLFFISCLLFTAWSFIRDITYCLNHSRHHKGVMVSAWQYLYIRSFNLFMCSFYVILHVLYDSWVSYDLFVSLKWLLLLLFANIRLSNVLAFSNISWWHSDAIQWLVLCFMIQR